MFNEETYKFPISLFNEMLFRKGVIDFFRTVQYYDSGAAREFWSTYPYGNIFTEHAADMFINLITFYFGLGLVPKAWYDAVVEYQEKLKCENSLLQETMMRLQMNIFAEGGEQVQEVWNNTIDRQFSMYKEKVQGFFELLVQCSNDFSGKRGGESSPDTERRRQIRNKFLSLVEFELPDAEGETAKGVVRNIGESGISIYSFIPLNKGQEIVVRDALPTHHQTFTVKWTNSHMTGLSA